MDIFYFFKKDPALSNLSKNCIQIDANLRTYFLCMDELETIVSVVKILLQKNNQ